jgi:hypothetical protein
MGALNPFSKPAMPAVAPAPLPPASNPVDLAAQDAESLKAARRAAAGGKASTYLTSPLGVTSGTDSGSFAKALLG